MHSEDGPRKERSSVGANDIRTRMVKSLPRTVLGELLGELLF
jgi:hypothetical protein